MLSVCRSLAYLRYPSPLHFPYLPAVTWVQGGASCIAVASGGSSAGLPNSGYAQGMLCGFRDRPSTPSPPFSRVCPRRMPSQVLREVCFSGSGLL